MSLRAVLAVVTHAFVPVIPRVAACCFVVATAFAGACVGTQPVSGVPAAITAGTAAPDFTLSTQDGTPLSLHDLRGQWVVLYFYPADFTGGCTLEAHNFERDIAKYHAMNAVILGVSVQDAKSHKEFCVKEGLSFRLLADTDRIAMGLYGTQGGTLGWSKRHTFLIDPQGVVRRTYLDVKPSTHSDEVLQDIAQLSAPAP